LQRLVQRLDQPLGRLGPGDGELAVEDHERHARDSGLVGQLMLAGDRILVGALGQQLQDQQPVHARRPGGNQSLAGRKP
ncbi:MAG: hypothetical protein RLZZ69_879, partial [Cyanobacteriota bacterium]